MVPSPPYNGASDAADSLAYEPVSALRGEGEGWEGEVGGTAHRPVGSLTLPSPRRGREERARGGLFLLFRRRYPKGDNFRHETGIHLFLP